MKRILFLALLVLTACSVKDAADFGFLPGNTPEDNSKAFQSCLDGGGRIVVKTPGVYDLCNTMLLDSDTDLQFAEGVTIRRACNSEGVAARYVFLNRGAQDRTYDENISVKGLHIECNGIDGGSDIPDIVGLRGHIAFFYARNIKIQNFELLDLLPRYFAIHICTFENAEVSDVHIEGLKDAVHFGPGRSFVVRNGVFKTFDDPIALNAHDYPGSNPEMGWIEDGLIENCYDLEDPEHGTTGYFARVIAGAWRDWEEGMEIHQHGDAVVSGGRIYRSNGPVEDKSYISTCRPTHEQGTVTYPDGIIWTMSQDQNVDYSCGVRNVLFRNIYLQKNRPVALSLHFDNDKWSRSYYPNAVSPVESEITFEGLHVEAEIPVLLNARTGVDHFTVKDSEIGSSKILLRALDTPGMVYDTTRITLDNVRSDDMSNVIISRNRPYKLEITHPDSLRVVGDNLHVQGIAYDEEKNCFYGSFTTQFFKVNTSGEILASIDNINGHIGAMTFDAANRRVFTSLECKDDEIGRGIAGALGENAYERDQSRFYVTEIDVDKMEMTLHELPEVRKDYLAGNYCCSGIDGVTLAPAFGPGKDAIQYLYVAYGIYGRTERDDNDYNVLLCYDPDDIEAGPIHKYFVLTGNTTYGVQNLAYDAYKDRLLLAVYAGKKEKWPNYDLFAVDMAQKPFDAPLEGVPYHEGTAEQVSFSQGWHFPYGSTGLCPLGDGTYYVSKNGRTAEGRQKCDIVRYKYSDDPEIPFAR